MNAYSRTITSNIETPKRVLAISAHPDDSELQAGATLAKWAMAGCEVSILVCTDGSKGTWDTNADLLELIKRRQKEQRAAAKALGATGSVEFCGWVDGEMQANHDSVKTLTKWIRQLAPNIVITHDPWKRYRLHPDHRECGRAVCDAVIAARDPHFFPDLGRHHRPDELWLFEADDPNHFEVAEAGFQKKIDALDQHKSQHESTMFIAEHDDGSQRQEFLDRLTASAQVDSFFAHRSDLAAIQALVGSTHGEPSTLIEAFARINDL